MALEHESSEGRSRRSPKARRDSGCAPLSPDEEKVSIEVPSLIETRSIMRVPDCVVPQLHSWKDVQTRGRDKFAFLDNDSMQGGTSGQEHKLRGH
jgi:hypothetical protein